MTRKAGRLAVLFGGVLALWLAVALVAWSGTRDARRAPLAVPADTVVLLTLDGVRMRELLLGADPGLSGAGGDPRGTLMPFLMGALVPEGVFLGDPARGSRFGLGHPVGVSMPNYQALFAGRVTACLRNECPPVRGGTLITSVVDRFGAGALGVFTSYGALCPALRVPPEAQPRCSAGLRRGYAGAPRQTAPEWGARDAAIIDAALQRLRAAPPRFLYIALEETDPAAHMGNYPAYLRLLREYDGYIRALATELARQAATGRRVTLLITTDHARGSGDGWRQHRWNVPGTDDLWLAAAGHGIAPRGRLAEGPARSSRDVRATVEYLLGLGVRPALPEILNGA